MNKFLFLLLVLFTSCGAAPLFSSLKEVEGNLQGNLSLDSSNIRTWSGDSRLSYAISWKEKPNFGGKSSFEIKFWDSYQNDFFGPYELLHDSFCAFLWMKMPDGNEHGSSPFQIKKKESSYFIDDVYFIMPGQWELRLRSVESNSDCNSMKNSPFISEEIIILNVN